MHTIFQITKILLQNIQKGDVLEYKLQICNFAMLPIT